MSRPLGKGLEALFLDVNEGPDQIHELPIADCRPNPYQPRKQFDEVALEELTTSIKTYGVIQPIIVRKSLRGYEIVAGERRTRAAKAAGLKTVPAVIKELTDEEMMEIALLENLQREDLTVIEEAQAYASLMEELNITQKELSERLGKSRSHIANIVRLLILPQEVQDDINSGELSMGHGRALLGLNDKSNLPELAKKIKAENLNVRRVEALVHRINTTQSVQRKKRKPKKDPFLTASETQLRERLGTGVNIKRGQKKGKVEIEFYSNEDLERLIEMLG